KETGRYVWEVPDESLWTFKVRMRVVDKAGNSTTYVWPDDVIVDLEKPTAGIQKVRGKDKEGSANPNPGRGKPQPPASPMNQSPPPVRGSPSPRLSRPKCLLFRTFRPPVGKSFGLARGLNL